MTAGLMATVMERGDLAKLIRETRLENQVRVWEIGWMNGVMDGQMDEWINGWMDGQLVLLNIVNNIYSLSLCQGER